MSAGHDHKTPNLLAETPRVRSALHRLLNTGMAPELMKRWNKLDDNYDIVYLAGYNVEGTTRFVDRDFFRALFDPDHAVKIIGAPIDTGMSPEDTLECVLRHEAVEKVVLDDPSNPIDLYDHHDEPGGFGAHEFATFGEHELVREKGGNPARYERGLKAIIAFCNKKPLIQVPKDYACAPLLDDPDPHEKRVIKRLQELGVTDAFKTSKEDLDYGPATGPDRCKTCAHWQGTGDILSTCAIADGLVAATRWCKKFAEATDEQAQGIDPQQPAGQRVRPAGIAQVPDAGQEPRGEREGAGEPSSA